ncbi:type III secretion system export apparatus subunit SctR [Sulfidibacter corallicola]|uniref:Type III secretion system export apparatus subunit SctR n=2 Tax=Sulfidibacter corallicola TaxID=2818388 RepID=A0A8A4TY07_SULCO|nr:type III secretion system export apparatus subunit SctR [Sulfidibacter corallicola]
MPDPLYIVLVLVTLSLAPFVAIMVTSFIKLVVVLSLVRNALGIQNIPPNMVINGLAIILTVYVMAPVGQQAYEAFRQAEIKERDLQSLVAAAGEAKEPIRAFLYKHSHARERAFFMRSAKALWPEESAANLKEDDLMVLVPAFTVSELTAAFQIGFMLYLPFIAIDLVVSNILLAMGMMMVSPMTISLPFKLLLFVLLDGWARLIHGLVLTYS